LKEVRRMSRRTVLYPTMVCNLQCPFCYYRLLQTKGHQDLEVLKQRINRWEDFYIDSVDVTGGEPLVYPKIVELIKYIKDKGYKATIITNMTLYSKVKELAEVGIDEFLVSIHGYNNLHEKMVNGRVWDRVLKFLEEAKEYNIPFRVNCVVTKTNYKYLEDIANYFLTLDTKIINFIVFNPHPGTLWSAKDQIEHQVQYSLIAKRLKKAIDILDKDKFVNVRYIPLCTMKDYEHHVTNFLQNIYEPYEWECLSQFNITREKVHELYPKLKTRAFGTNDLEVVMNFFRRKDIEKNIWSKKCMTCANRFICDGIYPQYYNRYGDKEFVPYKTELHLDPITYRLKDLRWLE